MEMLDETKEQSWIGGSHLNKTDGYICEEGQHKKSIFLPNFVVPDLCW